MATEVYNWVQKYDADLDNRQVSKLVHGGVFTLQVMLRTCHTPFRFLQFS